MMIKHFARRQILPLSLLVVFAAAPLARSASAQTAAPAGVTGTDPVPPPTPHKTTNGVTGTDPVPPPTPHATTSGMLSALLTILGLS